MEVSEIPKRVSSIGEATSGLSYLVKQVTDYFISLELLQILVLVLLIGLIIFAWRISNNNLKHNKYKPHQF